ncbi:class I SAM-dependent methyltransferase [Saccharopolyspora sp. NPDC047091]|uniref:class I SAM-dependent methyltransferase n=1 Tax=Saccharopolyspora sp. NPDC047091 TaxID=3155924 RepID=UPI0033DD5484
MSETSLVTLYLRACDAASRRPLLGDPFAADLVRRIDHDFRRFALGRGDAPLVAARARWLDGQVEEFFAAHPQGQVLHLGCGLDSRPLRVRPPAGSVWFDVDQPEVARLRREVYDLPPQVVVIGASVTEQGWWERVEPGRPTLVVAEGLLMYLDREQVRGLLERVVARCAAGRVVFDGVAGWMVGLSRRVRALQRAGFVFRWPVEDVGGLVAGVRPVRDESVIGLLAGSPVLSGPVRGAYRVLVRVPAMRGSLRLQRWDFG